MIPVNVVVELMEISNNKYQIANNSQLPKFEITNRKKINIEHQTLNSPMASWKFVF